MSAPAVTGAIALLLQQYAITYEVDLDNDPPLPSTIKAILIQTAKDLIHETEDAVDWDNPDTDSPVFYYRGPDYATGYGLVDAQAAVNLVKEKRFYEESIASPDEVDQQEFWVAPGMEQAQFTLVWDDEPDQDTYGVETDPRLINDLELRLIAPDGTIHQPWVLDPLTPASNIGDPDPIAAADITPAFRGEDHLNNVEQVTVVEPISGDWTVRVSVSAISPGLLENPQSYSLAGDFFAGHMILVDASRDGGTWWFPQAGPFDPDLPHQGKPLADSLRSLGMRADELPRPFTITEEQLNLYDLVIRAVGFGSYSDQEINAYTNYVEQGGQLLLLADHSANDGLANSFGLQFTGVTRGDNKLNNYEIHPLTDGVGEIYYHVGSGLSTYPPAAQIIGRLSDQSFLDLNYNGIRDAGEPAAPDVLGVMNAGSGAILFCGDINMWETVPQPLINNMLDWFLGE